MTTIARFAVGGPDDYRSAIWWLGVDETDAWVAAKPRGTWWRLTVHPDARGRLADPSGSGPTPPGPGGTLLRVWRPSGPVRTSWKHGFTILVPTLGPMEPKAHGSGEELDGVDWAPPAPEGQAVKFSLWAVDDAPDGDRIATLPLPSGDATLVRTYEPVPDGLMRYFRTSMSYAPTSEESGSLVNYDTGADYEALLFDLPLHSHR